MKKALILGISGQDGSYLADLLLKKGYKVYGGSRDAQSTIFDNLKLLNINNDIEKVSISLNDFRSVLQAIMRIMPDEIYNLSGQSSVSLSFSQPVETLESIVIGNLNILESIRFSNIDIKYYNAGSSEIFGNSEIEANENSIFSPKSPYGVSKAAALWQVRNYRESYNLYACTGILFNHESPFRKEHFVTAKIIKAVCRIANGKQEKLQLGNLDIWRDWGFAPEYVFAMWKMLQQEQSEDYVIATGVTMCLKDFVKFAFEYFKLNWIDYVQIDESLLRPSDIGKGFANASKAKQKIDWEANLKGDKLIEKLIDCELNSLQY